MFKFQESMRRSNYKIGIGITLVVLAMFGVALRTVARAPESKMIITWGGNTPTWDKKLHLNAIRIGCSSAPAGCVQSINKIAGEQHVGRVFLAILLAPSSINYGRQYSSLSVSDPLLYSVGFDDFVNQMERLHTSATHAAAMLNEFVSGLKSRNLNLHFGVTVYGNELASADLTSPALADVRNRTDFVHLFVHYRENGPDFANYVRQAKALFPNAQIIAGSYAVDRIDYLPCSRKARVPCTGPQEMSLFKKSFDVQLQLLRDGTVQGIEFYPGDFGNTARHRLWSDPRSCRPGRLPECIATSQQMRDYVGQELSRADL
ncbi:MAG: hypothetical protein ACRD5K_03685 [Candidatus Acidiferrales bacterium]